MFSTDFNCQETDIHWIQNEYYAFFLYFEVLSFTIVDSKCIHCLSHFQNHTTLKCYKKLVENILIL